MKLSLSHCHRQTDKLLHMLCAAPLSPFIQSPRLLFLLQLYCPPLSPGGSTYLGLRSLSNFLTAQPWLTFSETAPHGPARGRWQHGPLQLHPHGLDPHSAGHQDRQGYGRFGISPSSFDPVFTFSSPLSHFPRSAVAVCYFCAEPRNLQPLVMLLLL